jgi:hypothetical protein
MFFYFDGRPVQLADFVNFDGEPATVIDIVETEQQQITKGFDEPIIGFRTERLGAVYQSPTDRGWDGIVLLKRDS